MARTMAGWIAAALLPLLAAGEARGQSLAERVAAAPDGAVRFHFPARPGACGRDDTIILRDPRSGEREFSIVRGSYRGRSDRWADCMEGPVRVQLRSRAGRVEEVRVRVGNDFSGAGRELGAVTAAAAADYLLDLAPRVDGDEGEDALLAAYLADGVSIRPRLLALATDGSAPVETRRDAVFWAAQDGATVAELRRVYAGAPEAVREHVIFGLAQTDDPEAPRELLRLARDSGEPGDLREKAVFWLGQAAGRTIAGDLNALAGDDDVELEVREQAIFALSQRPVEEGVPALLRLAREGDPRLRQKAIFWLGQSGDPRALSLFAELLGIR